MRNHIKGIRYNDSIYKDLDGFKHLKVRSHGRFNDYLEIIGNEDSFFKSLKHELEVVGDLSVSTSNWFMKNHKEFDFTIPKNRLWVAIYILRIEEHVDKKMERYLKQKND